MRMPARVGERYLCFEIVREDRGWGGPYGQSRRPAIWRFDGQPIRRADWQMKALADHHECGHSPCPRCGAMLLRRKDGTPRQHAHNHCPGKDPGWRIEREFVMHMTEREYT